MKESEIIFLGTAGGRFAVNRQIRASGGFVIKVNGIQFHIDPGPGALVKAKEFGVNLRTNNVLVCSHAHLDHCNDINSVIAAMTHDGLDQGGIFLGSKSVVYGSEGERPYLSKRHRKQVDSCVSLTPGNKIKFGNSLELVATKTKHRDESAVGFKLFTDNFLLGYTSDTAYFEGVEEEFDGCDILIINTMKPFGFKSDDHFSSDDAEKLINKIRPKLAILTHFGQKMLEGDPIYQAREIQKRTGIQTIAARDGMRIDTLTYSASLQHKKLNVY